MARVTVEDCLDKVANRFILVLLSSQRARQLQLGASRPMVELDNDKSTVIALREIAEGIVDSNNVSTLVQHADPRLSSNFTEASSES